MEQPRRPRRPRWSVGAVDERDERGAVARGPELDGVARSPDLAQADRVAVEGRLRVEIGDVSSTVPIEVAGSIVTASLHGVADADDARLLDVAPDADRERLHSAGRPIPRENAQRVEVGYARVGILRRHRAPPDDLLDVNDRIPDRDGTTEPAVLLVLRDARDREEHPEAATVDRLPLGLPGQPIERAGRHERDAPFAAAIGARARLVGPHEPELAADEVGEGLARKAPRRSCPPAGLPKKFVSIAAPRATSPSIVPPSGKRRASDVPSRSLIAAIWTSGPATLPFASRPSAPTTWNRRLSRTPVGSSSTWSWNESASPFTGEYAIALTVAAPIRRD